MGGTGLEQAEQHGQRAQLRRGRHRTAALVLAWGMLALGLAWLVPRGVTSPGWFLAPLVVLLSTCLFGIVTGMVQAGLVAAALLVTAWMEVSGRLAPAVDTGVFVRAVVAAGVVVGTALCAALLHRTLSAALWVEDAQSERLDTTMRALRHRERLLRHALRVETVGDVSSMVVHQLRNQFQLIMGHAATGIRDGDPRTEAQFRAIVETLKGSNDVMESLLGLVRTSEERRRKIDLGDLCRAFCDRYRRLLPGAVQLQLCAIEGPLWVVLDPQGMEQALLNLVINARQAMDNVGTIHIEVGPAAGAAVVHVRDDGPGIDPDHLEHVFKPFFTTKPAGQGTGLGLAAVQRFVLASNGEVVVSGNGGRGACFTIRFPLAAPTGERSAHQQATG